MIKETKLRYIGNEWLLRERGVRPLVWKSTLALAKSQYEAERLNASGTNEKFVFSKKLWEGYDSLSVVDHIGISLKYEPLDLYVLTKALKSMSDAEAGLLGRMAEKKPASALLRRIGYLYEKLTGKEIKVRIQSTKRGYTPLLNPDVYYTAPMRTAGDELSAKWHIADNALGELGVFSPIIRRRHDIALDNNLISSYASSLDKVPDKIKSKIENGLYNADTAASFAIEGEEVDSERAKKFTAALKTINQAGLEFSEDSLSNLQRICTERGKWAFGYRDFQNAIGGRLGVPSYVCPPPEAISKMMEAIRKIYGETIGMDAAAAAAAVSGSFVLVHPFPDGNGRLSRLLISDAIARAFADAPVIPASMAIEKRRKEYIDTLARLTAPIMRKTDVTVKDGFYNIIDCDIDVYRYPDFTDYASFLRSAIEETVSVHVPKEIEKTRLEIYLQDATKDLVTENRVPPQKAKRIISSIAGNGRLSGGLQKKLLKSGILDERGIEEIHRIVERYSHKETEFPSRECTDDLEREQEQGDDKGGFLASRSFGADVHGAGS